MTLDTDWSDTLADNGRENKETVWLKNTLVKLIAWNVISGPAYQGTVGSAESVSGSRGPGRFPIFPIRRKGAITKHPVYLYQRSRSNSRFSSRGYLVRRNATRGHVDTTTRRVTSQPRPRRPGLTSWNLYCRVTHFRRRLLRMQGSDRVLQLA